MTDRAPLAAPAQAGTDAQLVELWLHGRSPHTRRAYRSDAARFAAHAGKPLPQVTLGDVQAFADRLAHLAPSTQARTLSAVKSLLAFGHRLGYLPFDVGRARRLPPPAQPPRRAHPARGGGLPPPALRRGLGPPELRHAPPRLRRRAARLGAGRDLLARPGYWLDYPKLSLSANSLWLVSNVCGPTCNASVMVQIGLNGLTNGSIGYSWFDDTVIGNGPASLVQTSSTSMYFASHQSTITLRVYQFTEGGSVTWWDISHPSYFPPPSSCPSPGNNNVCGNDNDWIRGGWVENGYVGFLWDAAQGAQGSGTYTYAYIDALELYQSSMAVADYPTIFSNSNAWAWGSVAVDNRGGLGLTAMWSTPSQAPSANELARDDVSAGTCGTLCYTVQVGPQGSNGPPDNAWGDYLTAHVASGSSNTWVATSYVLQCSPPNNGCTTVDPHFIWFGRQRDQTPTP